jgi:hypothetical protein
MSLPRSPMNAVRLLAAGVLAISLSACEKEQLARTILGQINDTPPTQRKAVIMKKLAGICPAPMTNEQRERAANTILRLAEDPDVVELIGRLDQFDAETLLCRGKLKRKRKPAPQKALVS